MGDDKPRTALDDKIGPTITTLPIFQAVTLLVFSNKRPEFIQFDRAEGEALLKAFIQEFGMLADQLVIPNNCSLMMMTRYPRNTAARGSFHAMLAYDLDVLSRQARVVERGVLRLGEVFLAVFAEILLVPGTILPILNEIFPIFNLEELTCGILTGDRAGTAGTEHAQNYS
jgi:hypothetical protein